MPSTRIGVTRKNGLAPAPIGRWVKGNFQPAPVVHGNDEIVYFLQCGKGGPVKIGTSRDGWGRVLSVAASMPHRMAFCSIVVGGLQLERNLHRRFRKFRLNGEWFKPEGELKDLMRKLPRSKPRELATHTLNIFGDAVAVVPLGVSLKVNRN